MDEPIHVVNCLGMGRASLREAFGIQGNLPWITLFDGTAERQSESNYGRFLDWLIAA